MADPQEIVVEGYSARYAHAVKAVLRREGGFVDDPADRGGATNYGISLRFLKAEGRLDLDQDGVADFDLDFDGDIDGIDIRKLTRGDAVYLYHRCFWLPVKADRFARPIGEAMFDQAVNGGLVAARKLLQRAINACYAIDPPNGLKPLVADGVLGPLTFVAYDAVVQYHGLDVLMEAYRDVTADRYRAIVKADSSQRRFLKGWLRRAADLGRDV